MDKTDIKYRHSIKQEIYQYSRSVS